jgi:hypothetical protein
MNVPGGITTISGQTGQSLKRVPGSADAGGVIKVLSKAHTLAAAGHTFIIVLAFLFDRPAGEATRKSANCKVVGYRCPLP